MKVLAINGSPRGREGNTERILGPFLEGTQDAGAETEIIYLKDKKINHCRGCFSCWTRTPGICVHHDDMPQLLEKVFTADMLVYATPLYCFTVTGLMKDFLDRNISLVTPAIEAQDGRYFHNARNERERSRMSVVISSCGFPGTYNFSGLLETFKVMTRGKLNAAILSAQGGILQNPNLSETLSPFFTAVRSAGREVAELGHIKPTNQAIIDKDLMDPLEYQQKANAGWQAAINQGTKNEGMENRDGQ
ncbi:MAG TPA: flavodoxin family protein [Firmicutes bacterium]|jgi:multimeric flavodoxin WrbA|nr:flavodoxin family protein [Bacillota bacterium]